MVMITQSIMATENGAYLADVWTWLWREAKGVSNNRKSPDVEIKCSTPKEGAYIQHSCKYFWE